MQKTVEYAVVNNRVSPATVELLIRERSKGKSLRQLGQMFGRSHERIRKVLAKNDLPQVRLLPEATVAAKLGYPVRWLTQLREESVSNAASRAHLVLIGYVESVASIGKDRGAWHGESKSRETEGGK